MPCRDCGSTTGDTCQTCPAKPRAAPTGVTVARVPTDNRARSPSPTCASNSISPPRAMRNSTPDPAPTTCPGSTARVSTSPAAGARMSRRPVRARLSASWACATRTRAAAASRCAVRRSISAREMKPRSTSAAARSSSDWVSRASASATRTEAASWASCCVCTARSTVASTCPAPTHWPGSTSTRTTWPPSPTTPTGISRRAARLPVEEITRSTRLRPGVITVTVGAAPLLVAPFACALSPAAAALGSAASPDPPEKPHQAPARIASTSRIAPIIIRRRRRTSACASSIHTGSPASAVSAWRERVSKFISVGPVSFAAHTHVGESAAVLYQYITRRKRCRASAGGR